jgi:hypothetical protein
VAWLATKLAAGRLEALAAGRLAVLVARRVAVPAVGRLAGLVAGRLAGLGARRPVGLGARRPVARVAKSGAPAGRRTAVWLARKPGALLDMACLSVALPVRVELLVPLVAMAVA